MGACRSIADVTAARRIASLGEFNVSGPTRGAGRRANATIRARQHAFNDARDLSYQVHAHRSVPWHSARHPCHPAGACQHCLGPAHGTGPCGFCAGTGGHRAWARARRPLRRGHGPRISSSGRLSVLPQAPMGSPAPRARCHAHVPASPPGRGPEQPGRSSRSLRSRHRAPGAPGHLLNLLFIVNGVAVRPRAFEACSFGVQR